MSTIEGKYKVTPASEASGSPADFITISVDSYGRLILSPAGAAASGLALESTQSAQAANVAKLPSAGNHAAVAKSDATVLVGVLALYVGTGGDVVVTDAGAVDCTYKNVPSGTTLMVQAVKVKAATTASDIVAMKA
jgi:hypothetical protein